MKRQDRGKNMPEPTREAEERSSPERTVAPPIEREHETQKGVFEEEEEEREHERQ